MAQLDVEPKKSNNDWWKWLLGILAAIAIIWLIVESTGNDDADDVNDRRDRETQIDTTNRVSLNTKAVASYGDYSSKA